MPIEEPTGWLSPPRKRAAIEAENTRLKQRVETLERQIADLRAERDRQYDENVNLIALQGAAEAERDRLREAGAYYIDRLKAAWAGKPVRDMGEAESAWRAALQKEPQP